MARQTVEQIEGRTSFWGKVSVYATMACTIIGIFGGYLVSTWTTSDTRNNYYKSVISDAIGEIDYNLGISWYTTDRYVKSENYFSSLRTDALWRVYYNSDRIFHSDKPIKDNMKTCLDEIDGINRIVPTQYSTDLMSAVSNVKSGAITIGDIDKFSLVIYSAYHQKMYDKFQQSAAPLMRKVKEYLIQKLQQL